MTFSDDENHMCIIQDVGGNLDDVSFVQLDANLNKTRDCIETMNRLRLIANTLYTFADIETYLKLLVGPDSFHVQLI